MGTGGQRGGHRGICGGLPRPGHLAVRQFTGHGAPAALDAWREYGYVEPLKKDYMLILIDARAHGKSDKPHDPESYTMQHRVGDVIVVLDDLNITSTHFFGFSYGGRHGWELAKFAPERLKSMMIMGMSPRLFNPDIMNQWVKTFEMTPQDFIDGMEKAGIQLSKSRKKRTLTNDHDALRAMFSNPWPDIEADLPNMNMPFLVLVGENDAMNPHEWLEQVCQHLPDAIFVTLPGLDHAQSWERSNLVLPHVKDFLAKVSKV